MASLFSVPLEVLLLITSYLSTPEYGCLRLTCNMLEARLFGDFAREFFSKRQFALVEFSIQALVDIAKSRLGPSLTHLIIHLEHPMVSAMGGVVSRMSVEQAVQYNHYQAECIKHEEFISTGLDVEMLSDAIRHLPNLETVGMRDFYSNSRNHDNTAWNSYGCPTFCESIRRAFGPHDSSSIMSTRDHDTEYTSHVFLTILRAIGNAAVSGYGTKLTRIEVLLHICHFRDLSFKIPNRYTPEVSLALSKITHLLLDGLSEEYPHFLVSDDDDKGRSVIAAGYFLSRFLAKTPALTHLRLNFRLYRPASVERFLLWLASARVDSVDTIANSVDPFELTTTPGSLPAHFPPGPEFPNLSNLDIGMATVPEHVLLALLTKYKSTLQGVSLHKIKLFYGEYTKINLWARLCNRMTEVDLELKKLSLSYLRQISAGIRLGHVTFKGSGNRDMKTWRGTAFSQGMKDLTDEMESHWQDSGNDDDDDDDDDDEDDDNDDSLLNPSDLEDFDE
ncbi:hypothetical protein F4802DRAFT_577711 [Xylaria palmicola]|nr:hypothetical protein F4802DRAFT_577711 [Xylaria palmicola]